MIESAENVDIASTQAGAPNAALSEQHCTKSGEINKCESETNSATDYFFKAAC